MHTVEPYQPADAHACVELWNSTPELGENFPLDLRPWRQNVEQSERTIKSASLVAKDDQGRIIGLIVCKLPKNICVIVVAPDFQRQGLGTELLDRATEAAAIEQPWTIGQDYNHFFPGVPEECDSALRFFEKHGYHTGTGFIYDLSRDLRDYQIAPEVQDKIVELRGQEIEIRECREADLSGLIDHLAANYSERWVTDTINRLNTETVPNEIIVARRTQTGEIIGFAHTYSNRSRYIGPSIMWRPLLGPKYGGLGPIGVAKDVRKIGLGLALLSFAVQSVKERGSTHMVIDWTVIIDFYAKVGFSPWKHYIAMHPIATRSHVDEPHIRSAQDDSR